MKFSHHIFPKIKQLSILVIYAQSLNGNLLTESKYFCFISDNLLHNTEAVFSYVSKIIPILKEQYPQGKKSIISLMVQAASIK